MAGDWIKLECTTPDKPEVFRIADVLGIDADAVLGKLCRVWIWADQQTINGDAASVTSASPERNKSVTKSLLDRVAGVQGFAAAMLASGWLIETECGVTFPNFDTHNGQTAKARALTRKRMEKRRTKCDAASVTSASPERNRSVTREEKRREEEYVPSERASSEVAPVTTSRKTADSPHHRCIAYFCEMWQQKYKEKYPFNAGKDAQAIKWLLGACGATEEGFRGVVGRYFADDDPFVANARHNLGLLRAQLAKWLTEPPAGLVKPAQSGFKSSAEKAREYAAATLIDALGGDAQ